MEVFFKLLWRPVASVELDRAGRGCGSACCSGSSSGSSVGPRRGPGKRRKIREADRWEPLPGGPCGTPWFSPRGTPAHLTCQLFARKQVLPGICQQGNISWRKYGGGTLVRWGGKGEWALPRAPCALWFSPSLNSCHAEARWLIPTSGPGPGPGQPSSHPPGG